MVATVWSGHLVVNNFFLRVFDFRSTRFLTVDQVNCHAVDDRPNTNGALVCRQFDVFFGIYCIGCVLGIYWVNLFDLKALGRVQVGLVELNNMLIIRCNRA